MVNVQFFAYSVWKICNFGLYYLEKIQVLFIICGEDSVLVITYGKKSNFGYNIWKRFNFFWL